MPASGTFPPAVFFPAPAGRAFAFGGATGTTDGAELVPWMVAVVADVPDFEDGLSRVSAAIVLKLLAMYSSMSVLLNEWRFQRECPLSF
jgi:hypothetical protein